MKEASILEQKAYRDTWGRGLDSYLEWFYETAVLLREMLAESGSIYVHLDWHVGHYAKTILDEVFGSEQFRNEIIWQRFNFHADAQRFGIVHETIYFYSKTENYVFNKQTISFKDAYIKSHFTGRDPDDRIYRLDNVTAPAHGKSGKPLKFAGKLLSPPPGSMWRFKQENIDRMLEEGRIVFTKTGMPAVKRYLDELEGSTVHTLWTDIKPVNSQSFERLNYNTQKPEALLERILRASSNQKDLVLDCFIGSGTTVAVAEKLNRRWIACDLGRFAIHTTRKRLLGIPNVKPFVVQNLGKYERQTWQVAEFPANGKDRIEEQRERDSAYRKFILDLYHATPITGKTWLHGTKAGRMVHVGAVDAPVTLADVKAIAAEVWKAVGTGKDSPSKAAVDILGWEFAFEVNEPGKQLAAESRVAVAFKKIPREVLEKKAVEQGDVQFFELGALTVDVKRSGRTVKLKLKDFVIPLDDVPEEARKAIKHWSQMIDYWAVDWDYKEDTFHNQWQSYRTRKEPNRLELEASYTYPEPGKYMVVVKVIDLLGNDTTKTLEVAVR